MTTFPPRGQSLFTQTSFSCLTVQNDTRRYEILTSLEDMRPQSQAVSVSQGQSKVKHNSDKNKETKTSEHPAPT